MNGSRARELDLNLIVDAPGRVKLSVCVGEWRSVVRSPETQLLICIPVILCLSNTINS